MKQDYPSKTRLSGRGAGARLISLMFCLVCSLAVAAQSYEEGRGAYINGDYERAFKILLPLASAGDAEAQKMLKSLAWYIRSAEQGQAAVQYQLGAKYFRGDGVEKDHKEATRWWKMAANGGQIDAQFNLGLLYFRGLSIEQDDEKAIQLFKQAARQGHSSSPWGGSTNPPLKVWPKPSLT